MTLSTVITGSKLYPPIVDFQEYRLKVKQELIANTHLTEESHGEFQDTLNELNRLGQLKFRGTASVC